MQEMDTQNNSSRELNLCSSRRSRIELALTRKGNNEGKGITHKDGNWGTSRGNLFDTDNRAERGGAGPCPSHHLPDSWRV